jgi:arylsulfatase
VSDTPFREYKHWVHEGGISTPLIVHWPNAIRKSRNGKLETQPGHIIDLMATCVALGKAKYPAKRDGEQIKPMEGINLMPAFNGKPLTRRQPLFWEHEGNRAVREGKWKLVAKENQPWELYDMEKDRSEVNDLALSYSKKVQQLAAKWDAFAKRADVLPLGTWHAKAQPKS